MMDIQATKLELIKMVVEANSEELLRRLKNLWKQAEKENGSGHKTLTTLAEPEPEWLTIAKQPTPAHIDLDALAKEQGYDGKKLVQKLQNFDHSLFKEQSLEELLNSLTK